MTFTEFLSKVLSLECAQDAFLSNNQLEVEALTTRHETFVYGDQVEVKDIPLGVAPATCDTLFFQICTAFKPGISLAEAVRFKKQTTKKTRKTFGHNTYEGEKILLVNLHARLFQE